MNGAPGDSLAKQAAALRVIVGAMAGGVALLGAVTLFLFVRGPAAPASPKAFDTLRLFSIVDAVLFLSSWAMSGVLFQTLSAPGTFAALQSAVIVRAAAREGSALLGIVVCLLGALSGALRVQPAYWANALPGALFVGWVLATLPSEDSIRGLLLDGSAQKR